MNVLKTTETAQTSALILSDHIVAPARLDFRLALMGIIATMWMSVKIFTTALTFA